MKEPHIKVKDLTKFYGRGKVEVRAVDGVTFEVSAGSIFAFLGPNGAGKTTTIKMLTTLEKPTSGMIVVNGSNPVEHPNLVRQSFGIVFQDASTDDELTAYENMFLHAGLFGVSRSETPAKIKEMLEFVDLWDRRDSLVKTFSGGMRRRLEIARGLLHTPAILFLDEPTVGLDPQTRNHIWNYLKKLNVERGLTIFFTTHYMDEVERTADRVAIIDHGKLIAMDSVDGIRKQAGADNLEDAFIKLTGHGIREQDAGAVDHLRQAARVWGKKR